MARAPSPAPRDDVTPRPCVGAIETCSIATGLQAADAILWQSAVEMLFCEPVSPGKFVSLFTGAVEEVQSSVRRGAEVAGGDLTDHLVIPNLEPQILDALCGKFGTVALDAIGVIETDTVATLVVAADVAAKTALVAPVELRLANALGGKAFVTFVGAVGDVRAAIAAGAAAAAERGHLAREVVIAGPHPEMARFLRAPTHRGR